MSHWGSTSPSVAVSLGAGTPAAAAKAAAKAAKYGKCLQERQAQGSSLPSDPWGIPRPFHGLGDPSHLKLNGLLLCPSVAAFLLPPQTCLVHASLPLPILATLPGHLCCSPLIDPAVGPL